MVTLEHTIATVLLVLYGTPEKAAAMLNEALVPGIEVRLSLYAAKRNEERAADRAAVDAGYMTLAAYVAKWGDSKKCGDA